MKATNEQSQRFETPREPVEVEVYVDTSEPADWHFGTLREWTFYEAFGWTGWVQYSTGASETRSGRFLAEHVRQT